jgi:hypothetical protein
MMTHSVAAVQQCKRISLHRRHRFMPGTRLWNGRELWMNLQTRYDWETAREALGER